MAGPLRGGGGSKGPAIKDFCFYILLSFKNKHYFTLDNLLKYGHIALTFVCRYFYWVVTIFSKKLGYFIYKIGGRKKIVKICFRLFKD